MKNIKIKEIEKMCKYECVIRKLLPVYIENIFHVTGYPLYDGHEIMVEFILLKNDKLSFEKHKNLLYKIPICTYEIPRKNIDKHLSLEENYILKYLVEGKKIVANDQIYWIAVSACYILIPPYVDQILKFLYSIKIKYFSLSLAYEAFTEYKKVKVFHKMEFNRRSKIIK